MNQFLQIMNEDTENSQFDVDIFCCLFLGSGGWRVLCYIVTRHFIFL